MKKIKPIKNHLKRIQSQFPAVDKRVSFARARGFRNAHKGKVWS